MARTAQTRAPPKPILRVEQFVDHAGVVATRARLAQPGAWGDIANNFRTNPVFAFQVYSIVPLDLEQPSWKRMRVESATDASNTNTYLLTLVNFLGGSPHPERAPPVYEIYSEQPDAFACVAHQKREIAHRKAQAGEPQTLLIPRLELDWASDVSNTTGFCFVLTSDKFKRSRGQPDYDADDNGVILARFMRGQSIWPFEICFTNLGEMGHRYFDPRSTLEILYGRSFSRRSIDCDAEVDDDEVVRPLETYCQVGKDEGEDAAEVTATSVSEASLEALAQRLSLDTFSLMTGENSTVTLSNHKEQDEPDLRYMIYAPFLTGSGAQSSLEQVAKAFTASITSRISRGKTISFEFRKPSDANYGPMLEDFRQRIASQPEDFYGALLDLDTANDSPSFRGRLHCNDQSLWRSSNVPDESEDGKPTSTRYKTFMIILRGSDIEAAGNVEYLLADAVPGSEVQDEYPEMMLWRNHDIDETARRLEMRFDN